jgi:hypothetical protein
MPYRIIKTTDNQHIGTVLEYIEEGQVVTFSDGDVVPVQQIFTADDGNTLLACGVNYQMTLVKE